MGDESYSAPPSLTSVNNLLISMINLVKARLCLFYERLSRLAAQIMYSHLSIVVTTFIVVIIVA